MKKPLNQRLKIFPLLLLLFGLVLALGGLKLLTLGGSSWYFVFGTLCAPVAILLWRGNRWGAYLYGVMLLYTLLWAVWEVGVDGWALLPRLVLPVLIGLWFLTPSLKKGLHSGPQYPGCGVRWWKFPISVWVVVFFAVAVVIGSLRYHQNPVTQHAATVPFEELASDVDVNTEGDWLNYGNDSNGTRYSSLNQISPENIGNLKLAWQFQTGDLAGPKQGYSYEATPLKVGDLLYLCTPSGQVFALDAESGAQRWHFDAQTSKELSPLTCRGVSYYNTNRNDEKCVERIYVVTPDAKLWGLDALSGERCPGFGEGASFVDLLVGLGEVPAGKYMVTSPPVVAKGKLVVGAKIPDNISTDMPSGVVRAFDAITGQLAWAWDAGQPTLKGLPAPGETYTRSTPNAWAPFVADDELGIVYIPTGNPSPDFSGKLRRTFDESYGSALVALDSSSGEEIWHFQTVHHDLWDNDLPSQPVLAEIKTADGPRKVVILSTKTGDIFVLDRKTGEPVVEVTEKPVPRARHSDEPISPTQPSSALALNPGPDFLKESHMWGLTPFDQLWCRIQFQQAGYEGPFTPPDTTRAVIAYPGMFGGMEWGGVSLDPQRNILIANPSAMPFLLRVAKVNSVDSIQGDRKLEIEPGMREMKGTGYAVSFGAFMSPLQVPCMQPPWGKLYAIDLNTQQLLWERPVGTARDTGPLGMPGLLPLLIGTPQVGGSLVTASGLIFVGATLDNYFRAYDVRTGEELWRSRLPAGGQATPMTYQVSGQQFVVMVSGGHGILGTKAGDSVLAYTVQ